MMKTLRNYTKVYLGTVHNERIYLSPPSWDCGWYWGFGYLGNKNCHYHVDGLKKHQEYDSEKKVFKYEFLNLRDGFLKHFGDSLMVRRSELWKFAELFETFYKLRETAEVLGHGGSHLTNNPCSDIIKNKEEVNRINEIVLPAVFDEIYKILERNQNNEKLFKKLVEIDNKGLTSKTIDFMFEKGIHTDDLKCIQGLNSDDINRLHSEYWRVYHSNKK